MPACISNMFWPSIRNMYFHSDFSRTSTDRTYSASANFCRQRFIGFRFLNVLFFLLPPFVLACMRLIYRAVYDICTYVCIYILLVCALLFALHVENGLQGLGKWREELGKSKNSAKTNYVWAQGRSSGQAQSFVLAPLLARNYIVKDRGIWALNARTNEKCWLDSLLFASWPIACVHK